MPKNIRGVQVDIKRDPQKPNNIITFLQDLKDGTRYLMRRSATRRERVTPLPVHLISVNSEIPLGWKFPFHDELQIPVSYLRVDFCVPIRNENFLKDLLKNRSIFSLSFYHSIDIENFRAITDFLRNSRYLKSLTFIKNGNIDFIELARALEVNQSLRNLTIYRNNIQDQGLIALARALEVNSVLTYLGLGGNKIGDQGVMAISRALRENKALKVLNLGYNNIGNAGALDLAEALRVNNSLEELDISGNNGVGDQGVTAIVDALKVNRGLKKLVIDHNQQIGESSKQAIAAILARNETQLESLSMFFVEKEEEVVSEGMRAIIESLRTNTTLKSLNIGCNNIGDEEFLALFENLKSNKTLTTLGLSKLYVYVIYEEGEDNRVVNAIIELINTNTTIKSLDLSKHEGEYGEHVLQRNVALEKIAQALKSNTTLTKFNIFNEKELDNDIDFEEEEEVAAIRSLIEAEFVNREVRKAENEIRKAQGKKGSELLSPLEIVGLDQYKDLFLITPEREAILMQEVSEIVARMHLALPQQQELEEVASMQALEVAQQQELGLEEDVNPAQQPEQVSEQASVSMQALETQTFSQSQDSQQAASEMTEAWEVAQQAEAEEDQEEMEEQQTPSADVRSSRLAAQLLKEQLKIAKKSKLR